MASLARNMQIEPTNTQRHLITNWELNRLCEEFNLRAEELRGIVKKVGYRVENIRKFLAKKKGPLREPSMTTRLSCPNYSKLL